MHDYLGIAIDIGTTTVAVYLVDTQTGERLGVASRHNAQAVHGADVTSRIEYCAKYGHEKLTALIREQIDSMIRALCTDAQIERIEQVVIAGNTVMQHLVAGYTPVSLGAAPFTPISLFGEDLPAWESLPATASKSIYYAPCISAYVGGDITAGLYAAGFEDVSKPALFIDIGTNGEIVLKHKGTYYCCAAAAGPAFEGAEITMGMAAVDGAIDHVWRGENEGKTINHGYAEKSSEDAATGFRFSVIGKKKPQGLCGSGLLDLLAALLETGIVDETGRLLEGDRFYLTGSSEDVQESGESKGRDSKSGRRGEDKSVYVTAADIRKLQLAKAAIAGGIQVLLRYAGIKVSDITSLALAGGFGSYMRLESAARIGLFPKPLLPVAKAYGNTAGEGAAMMLCSEDARMRLYGISKRCEYIELSSNAFFNEKFVEGMGF